MRGRQSAYRVLLFTSLATISVFAQESQRPPGIPAPEVDTLLPRNTAGIVFDRNLNTYSWIGRTFIDTAVAGNKLLLNGQYNTTIIQVDATPTTAARTWESNLKNLSLLTGRAITQNISADVQWSSLVYSDNRGLGLSNASIHSLLGGIEYSPFSFVSLSPMAGYRWDTQADFHDRGLTMNIGARAHDIDVDGYRIAGSAQYHEDRLDPRMLASHFIHSGAQKQFSGLTRDSVQLDISRSQREFYAIADSNIESRIENVFSFSNLLDYEVERNILATLFVTITSRGLERNLRSFGTLSLQAGVFDTRIDEFRLDTYLQASYRSDEKRTGASIRFYHSERNELHAAKPSPDTSPSAAILFAQRDEQERSKDNLSRRSSLSGFLDIPLSQSDQLTVSGAGSILRYDTPSPLNVEDRDELLIAVTIGTMHRISRYLDLGILLDGNLSHIVYLLKERSANNNINRVLRLSPRITYRPVPAVTTMNSFEVLANYTVYDFEQQLVSVRSFSYRQFAWVDSTSIEFTRRIGLDFFAYLKLYERGQLRWDEFTERLENSFVDKTYAVQLRYSPAPHMLFAVGARYFSQSRYSFGETGKRLESFVRSFGPTCVILWEMGPHSQMSFRGWYEQRRQTDGTSLALASMNMNILLNF